MPEYAKTQNSLIKHAFLIQAHNNKQQLEKLINYLDCPHNDIFVHIDAKSKELEGIEDFQCKYSTLYFIPRIEVFWGGYSQIKVEMALLFASHETNKYLRYHLISGADLPLVGQSELYKYFDRHDDFEFVHFDKIQDEPDIKKRMLQYHILRDHIDRTQRFLCFLEKVSIGFQTLVGINRLRNADFEIKKGANWFSITNDCVELVLSKKDWIEKYFKSTKCCDEVFLQTIVYNSSFISKLYPQTDKVKYGNMRFTDWNRGNPFTFREEDFELLMSSGYIFARKFDEKIDNRIIEKIYDHLSGDR